MYKQRYAGRDSAMGPPQFSFTASLVMPLVPGGLMLHDHLAGFARKPGTHLQ